MDYESKTTSCDSFKGKLYPNQKLVRFELYLKTINIFV